MPLNLPPYALDGATFRFRALAALAGRAPIGGVREVALACFVAARLADQRGATSDDESEARRARSDGARGWLGTLALPAGVRGPALRCAESSGSGPSAQLGRDLATLSAAAATYLDAPSRQELDALATALRR